MVRRHARIPRSRVPSYKIRVDRSAHPIFETTLVKGRVGDTLARELGGGISRYAVLAKIPRLGIIAVRPHRRRSQRFTRKGNRTAFSHAIPNHRRATKTAS